jgi:hypothetical protein
MVIRHTNHPHQVPDPPSQPGGTLRSLCLVIYIGFLVFVRINGRRTFRPQRQSFPLEVPTLDYGTMKRGRNMRVPILMYDTFVMFVVGRPVLRLER